MRARRSVAVGILGFCLLAACSSPSPAPSSAMPSPSASVQGAANLPPGCETYDLRSPAGVRVVLDGTWVEVGAAGQLMTWYFRTQGDCVWGTGHIEDVPPEGSFDVRPDHVQSLSGRMGSDYVITGEILSLAPLPPSAPGEPSPYSPLRMFIEFDDSGEILLREDREPGVSGPRCPDPGGYCPAPLVLQLIEP